MLRFPLLIKYEPSMKKFSKTFLLFFLISSSVFSQSKIVTLEDAINLSLGNNRDIKISQLSVYKAKAAVNEAFGYALPSLDVAAGLTHFIDKPKMPFPNFEALLTNATYNILFEENVLPRDNNKFLPLETQLQSFAQSNNFESSVTVSQILFNSTVFRGIGASQVYYDLSVADLKNTISKTILNVEKAFYGYLLTKKMLEITEASFVNAQKNYANVNALYEQGLVSDFDRMQAEIQVENIRPTLMRVENILASTLDGLKMIIGVEPGFDIEVYGEIKYTPEELADEQDYIDYALTSNHALQTLRLKMNVDEEFIALDVSRYWPSLTAFGNYTYAGSSDKWNFQTYSSTLVGLNFSINLWEGHRTKNRVEQATITFKQTSEQVYQFKDFLVNQVKSNLLEIKRVQSLVDAQTRNVSLAERAYEIATIRYREGTGSQLEVQNSDVSLQQARTNLLESIHSYIITKYELDQLIGKIDSKYIDPLINID